MELHIVFNYSAAGSVRTVLAGREAAAARFSDNLSYGPINPPEPAVRRAWIEDHLGFDNPDITGDVDTFWPEVLAKNSSRVAWVSRRSASEYCNFLEYLRRLGDLPTQIIDTTDAINEDGEFFHRTGSIPSNHTLAGLLDSAHEVTEPLRSDSLPLWQKLRPENSVLRVLDRNLALSSVPLSFYDRQLLSLVNHDWQSMAFIVGSILVDRAESDLLLFSRLYALVDSGVLALRESGRRHPDVKLVSA